GRAEAYEPRRLAAEQLDGCRDGGAGGRDGLAHRRPPSGRSPPATRIPGDGSTRVAGEADPSAADATEASRPEQWGLAPNPGRPGCRRATNERGGKRSGLLRGQAPVGHDDGT